MLQKRERINRRKQSALCVCRLFRLDLFVRGKEAEIKQRARFTAFDENDTWLPSPNRPLTAH